MTHHHRRTLPNGASPARLSKIGFDPLADAQRRAAEYVREQEQERDEALRQAYADGANDAMSVALWMVGLLLVIKIVVDWSK